MKMKNMMKAEATRFGQEVLSYGGLRASRKEYRETLWFVALVCCFGNSGDHEQIILPVYFKREKDDLQKNKSTQVILSLRCI